MSCMVRDGYVLNGWRDLCFVRLEMTVHSDMGRWHSPVLALPSVLTLWLC